MPTESLISALEYLGVSADSGDQDSRILIQKIAYLLQVLDYGIDFKFFRGSRGPYSFHLNKEVFDNKWLYDELQSSYELTDQDKVILRKLKHSGVPFTVPRLEGATSAILLMREDPNRDDIDILKELRKWKETFSQEQLVTSLTDAKKILFREEYLTPALKNELVAWQDIGIESLSRNLP